MNSRRFGLRIAKDAELLVLDANILIRAVLGTRVRGLLSEYGSTVAIYAPVPAFAEARTHLPAILERRNIEPFEGLAVLDSVSKVVQTIGPETYSTFEHSARDRLRGRDEADWPVLAAAMALECAIWTEDFDFFGAGVATWTTARIEIFLRSVSRSHL